MRNGQTRKLSNGLPLRDHGSILAGEVPAAVTVRFESGASGTALTGQMTPAQGQTISLPYCPLGHFETAVNTLLNLELGGAQAVAGYLVYCEV